MNAEFDLLAQRAAGALFNGVYQSLIPALVLWAGMRLFPRTNAATRHAVGMMTLFAMACLPIVHFIQSDPKAVAPLEVVSVANDTAVPSDSVSSDFPVREAAPDDPIEWSDYPESEFQLPAPAIPSALIPPIDSQNFPPAETTAAEVQKPPQESAAPAHLETVEEPAVQNGIQSGWATMLSGFKRIWKLDIPDNVALAAMTLVLSISAILLLRLVFQLIALNRIKRSGIAVRGPAGRLFESLRNEIGVHRPVRFLASDRVSVPIAVGWFHPVVMVPADLFSDPDHPRALESILRHELAHVQRWDDWSNLMQQFLAALCFFNPAIYWLSRRLATEREIACDDHALARSRSPQDYAMMLTEFAGRMRGRDWIVAPAAWTGRNQLKERIHMILDTKRNTSLRLARTTGAVLVAVTFATALAAVAAGPRLVFAEAETVSGDALEIDPAIDVTAEEPNQNIDVTAEVDPFSDDTGIKWKSESGAGEPAYFFRNGDAVIHVRAPVEVRHEGGVELEAVPKKLLLAQSALPPAQPAPPKQPAPAARPPAAPHPESLEARIERLERMLEQMAGRRADRTMEFHVADPSIPEMNWKEKENNHTWHFDAETDFHFEHPEVFAVPAEDWPISEEEQREIERSLREAEKEVAKAVKDVHIKLREARAVPSEDVFIQRKEIQQKALVDSQRTVLERKRQALEQQMENMHRQMENLDLQMQMLDGQLEQFERQDELTEEQEESLERQLRLEPKVKSKASH